MVNYDGSLENRLCIIVDVADECRKQVKKDFVITIKINSVEFKDKAFTLEEAKD